MFFNWVEFEWELRKKGRDGENLSRAGYKAFEAIHRGHLIINCYSAGKAMDACI